MAALFLPWPDAPLISDDDEVRMPAEGVHLVARFEGSVG